MKHTYALTITCHSVIKKHTLSIHIDYLPPFVAAVIERSVGRMSEQGVSNVLMGLGRMGVKWVDLPRTTRLALLRALGSVGEILTQQGLSNVLWAIAVMGAPVALSSSTTISTCATPTTTTNDGSGDSLLDEEGRMTARQASESLSSALQRLISTDRTSSTPPFSAQTLSSVLYALALASVGSSNHDCGCAYADLNPTVQQALEAACLQTASTMDAREVSLSFYGLGTSYPTPPQPCSSHCISYHQFVICMLSILIYFTIATPRQTWCFTVDHVRCHGACSPVGCHEELCQQLHERAKLGPTSVGIREDLSRRSRMARQ